ncbi:Similar to Dlgap4: Disks large-associated protein 4 (Mus musculus), partial [Cotesia congregata]
MTSQESIGSCSLDVDRSASDRSGWIYKPTVDSVSERTLHSLNLSSNGDTTSAGGNSSEIIQKHNQQTLDKQPEQIIVDNCDSIINGENEPTAEQLTTKKPSYLGLACSISGYSGITRYDSKLREGFRSRDSSPGSRLITRETSPAGFRSNENLGVPPLNYPTKSQSISPLAMDRQNGFTNGKECKIETFVESRSTLNVFQGYSEVDRGVSLHPNFPDVSPILSVGNKKTTTTLTTTTVVNNKANKSYSPNSSYASSPRGMNNTNLSNISCAEDSFLNGSSIEIESQTLNLSSSSEKSFIQQRVERLYGPGALAQGFFRRSNQSQNSDNSFNNKSSLNNSSNINNNDLSLDNANNEESLKNLPVLRHLRPEFRAQLPVVSPRRPTDGNQQPAAPEVVLPVLETSVSSTSLAELPKATQEDNAVEVKDGHYFMKLLKAEIDRLFKLAASAEAELANVESLPEEAAGKLRSAAGKARLLATQKMQQFEGLCQKNITQIPGEVFPTTNEDLAGFWDMVMLQVVQVNDIFEHLDKLRNSQWQEVCSRSPVNVPGLSSKPIQSNHPIHGPKLSPNVEKPFQQIPKSPQSVSKPNRPISKPKSGIPRAINTIKHGKMIFKSPKVAVEKTAVARTQQNGNNAKRRVINQKPKATATSEANRKAREAREQARRQMMEDRRKSMKTQNQQSVEIFAPKT